MMFWCYAAGFVRQWFRRVKLCCHRHRDKEFLNVLIGNFNADRHGDNNIAGICIMHIDEQCPIMGLHNICQRHEMRRGQLISRIF